MGRTTFLGWRRRTRGAMAALAVMTICGMLAVLAPAPTPAMAAGVGLLNPWAEENENANPRQQPIPWSQAQKDAQYFNFITAHPVDYQGEVAQMKQVNPRLILLAYENAVFIQSGQSGGKLPESAYLHDKNGKRITNRKSGNTLMNPASAQFVETRTFECKSFLAQSGYDGCYLDLLGLAPLSLPFVSAVAINPATNRPYTPAQWLAATGALAASVRAAVHPRLLYGNGLSNGASFFGQTQTDQLVNDLDGGIAEAWLRGSKTPVGAYPSETVWRENVDMLAYLESQGKPLLTLTKLWVNSTTAQTIQWFQYALASFVLGSGGVSAFFFSPAYNVSRTTPCYWCYLPIGSPAGGYAKVGGVYQRSFSTGKVLVNPTPVTVSVPLGGTYKDAYGHSMSVANMAPDTGLILTSS
jgi:hypothetical protein